MNCDAKELVKAARCFDCIPKEMRTAVKLSLMAKAVGATDLPAVLVRDAKCFNVPREVQRLLLLSLLATWAGCVMTPVNPPVCPQPTAPSLVSVLNANCIQTSTTTGDAGGKIRLYSYANPPGVYTLVSEQPYQSPFDWTVLIPSLNGRYSTTEIGNGSDYCGESPYSNIVRVSPP